MSEHPTDARPDSPDDAPDVAEGTDISADSLDVSDGAQGDTPATSDPDQHTDDATLGGTSGAGGAG